MSKRAYGTGHLYEKSGAYYGRWRSFDGMPERGDFLLRCQPGSKRCIFGADWNSVRRERAQIRPQVSIRTNFACFRGPDCFEDKRRPAVNLQSMNTGPDSRG